MKTTVAGSRWAKTQDFHPTLSSVRAEIEARLIAAEAVLAPTDVHEDPLALLTPYFDGIPYTKTFRGNAGLASLKGKSTSKWAHASIFRMESGTYELTFYIA